MSKKRRRPEPPEDYCGTGLISGWKNIARFCGDVTVHTAMALEKSGMPVYRWPIRRAPVIIPEEVIDWLKIYNDKVSRLRKKKAVKTASGRPRGKDGRFIGDRAPDGKQQP